MWNTSIVADIVDCGCCPQDFVALALTAHFMEAREYDPNEKADQEVAGAVYEAFKWANEGNLVDIVPVMKEPDGL